MKMSSKGLWVKYGLGISSLFFMEMFGAFPGGWTIANASSKSRIDARSNQVELLQIDELDVDPDGVAYDIITIGNRALVGILFGGGGVHSLEVSKAGALLHRGYGAAGNLVRDLVHSEDVLYLSVDSLSNGGIKKFDSSNPDSLIEISANSEVGPENSRVGVTEEFIYAAKFEYDIPGQQLQRLNKTSLTTDKTVPTAGYGEVVLAKDGYIIVMESGPFNGVELFDNAMALKTSIAHNRFPYHASVLEGDLFVGTEFGVYVYDVSALPAITLKTVIAVPNSEVVTGLARSGDLLFGLTWEGNVYSFNIHNWDKVIQGGTLSLPIFGSSLALMDDKLLAGGSAGESAKVYSIAIVRSVDPISDPQ
ncbi:MAG TPA: hypothetical protein VE954_01820 [Oligoflexus sp.]|uniref:hypothetical protein n=1 Tax=Oligoflexus sp. TaxID=1971216 RepID=UPI002D28AA65|nr:hypothetical protein [Oligoflexus sp.]HYX31822.1 hypothetical protein [Oligoflexus sp.]